MRFVCVGDRGTRPALDELARDLDLADRLIWSTDRSDTPAVYNALDVRCLSSTTESFPNVVAESMACGTPCVVTDVGDAARIAGDIGRVVPVGDPGAMADAVQLLVRSPEDERRRWQRALRDRIVEHYPVERMIERTERALQGVVDRRARTR